MEDRRDHRLVQRPTQPPGHLPSGSWKARLGRLWTPGVRIRAILLMICLAAFAKYGVAEGTGLVMLAAGLMLLVPWFLNSLLTALRPEPAGARKSVRLAAPPVTLAASGILLVAALIISWYRLPHNILWISAGIGLVFFLLHALTQPWLRRKTG